MRLEGKIAIVIGAGQSPPRYLADGDAVELGIDGLGSARQRLRAYRSHAP